MEKNSRERQNAREEAEDLGTPFHCAFIRRYSRCAARNFRLIVEWTEQENSIKRPPCGEKILGKSVRKRSNVSVEECHVRGASANVPPFTTMC